MILVVSINPAIDIRLDLKVLTPGDVNRVRAREAFPGGKGWHVAQTVLNLGGRVRLCGFLAGPEGDWMQSQARHAGIETRFHFIPGNTRRCESLHEDSGRITEILEPGPEPTVQNQEDFVKLVAAALDDCVLAVFTGSLLPGMEDGFYRQLIESAKSRNVTTILDTSGKWLIEGSKALPFCIKPNRDEFAAMSATCSEPLAPSVPSQYHAALLKMQSAGIRLPMVSLGSEGLLFAWEDRVGCCVPPKVESRNPVGSGDCLIGGLALGLAKGLDCLEAIRVGVGCGAANAMNPQTGFFSFDQFQSVVSQVRLDWPFKMETGA